MKLLLLSLAVALAGIGAAADTSAQMILQIRVVPAKPKAGETTTLAGRFSPGAAAPHCNVRVDFGDETPEQDVHITETKELPLLITHVFAVGGDFMVSVRPRPDGAVPACDGGSHSTLIEVQAP
jgi:hypothetical protein